MNTGIICRRWLLYDYFKVIDISDFKLDEFYFLLMVIPYLLLDLHLSSQIFIFHIGLDLIQLDSRTG